MQELIAGPRCPSLMLLWSMLRNIQMDALTHTQKSLFMKFGQASLACVTALREKETVKLFSILYAKEKAAVNIKVKDDMLLKTA